MTGAYVRGLGSLRGHFRPDGRAKVAYATRAAAEAWIAEHPGSKRRPNNAYRCRDCGAFHVGRRPAK